VEGRAVATMLGAGAAGRESASTGELAFSA
jgi:hypothetical protein